MLMEKIGVYLHIPFCRSKCPYCDFFSHPASENDYESYTDALCRSAEKYGKALDRQAETIYFGGGTPSLIGEERLSRIYRSVLSFFGGQPSEVTVEVNPEKRDIDFVKLRNSGFDRISVGLQSANDVELKKLGRIHTVSDAEYCINRLKSAGFENFSLDLMLATPLQTRESLERSIDFCAGHGAKHISAYLLKIEEGTAYHRMASKLCLPDEDEQAELYLFTCERLKEYGYHQYEISNFALPGYESRHNLKYWRDEEYIGLGPSAHSFVDGKRFFFDRSMEGFLKDQVTQDGDGGNAEEWLMLRLRLSEGIVFSRFRERFSSELPEYILHNARRYQKTGLVECDENGIRLTTKGFLLSNSLIASILM